MIEINRTLRKELSRRTPTAGTHTRPEKAKYSVDANPAAVATPLSGILVFAGFMLVLFGIVSWLL